MLNRATTRDHPLELEHLEADQVAHVVADGAERMVELGRELARTGLVSVQQSGQDLDPQRVPERAAELR